MDLKETGLEGVDWIHLAQWGPVKGFCADGYEPPGSIKSGEFLD